MLMHSYNRRGNTSASIDAVKRLLPIIELEDLVPVKWSNSHNGLVYGLCCENDNDPKYFIKISDMRFPAEHVYSEIEGIKLARKAGLSVPDVVTAGVQAGFSDKDISYIVTRPLRGTALVGLVSEINESVVYATLSEIDKLKEVSRNSYGAASERDNSYLQKDTYVDFISDVFGYACKKIQDRYGLPEVGTLKSMHSELGPGIFSFESRFVLSHKDPNVKNVFLMEDGNIGIIDWEWSLYLDRVTDYAIFLISLLFDVQDENLFNYAFEQCITHFRIKRRNLLFHLGRESLFSIAFSKRKMEVNSVVASKRLELALRFMELCRKLLINRMNG